MIIDNRFTEIGDSAVIKSGDLVLGVVKVSGYTDSTVGETASRYFTRKFRYSTNGGITYSSWADLTQGSVSEIVTKPTSPFIIEYLYTRSGTDSEGELKFLSVQLDGEFIPTPPSVEYVNSVFSDFFDKNDPKVLEWCLNVTEKLYRHGIVPEYFERGKGGDDEDYITLWSTIACFFSLIVNLYKSLADFSDDERLLADFLRDRGLFISNNNDYQLMLYLMSNYHREMRKRGTMSVFDYSDEYIGEFYRLIESAPDTILIVYPKYLYSGWFADRNSPTYSGNYEDDDFIVGFGRDHDANDEYLDKYLDVGSADVIGESIQGDSVMAFDLTSDSSFTDDFIVDCSLDYEVTMWVKIPAGGIFSVSAELLSIGDWTPLLFKSVIDGSDTNGDMIIDGSLAKPDEWYRIRCLVHRKDLDLRSSGDNESFTGRNIAMPDLESAKMILHISATVGVRLHDIKCRVASRYSNAINYNNAMQIYAKNNNSNYSPVMEGSNKLYPELEDIIRTYLLSYRNTLIINWL